MIHTEYSTSVEDYLRHLKVSRNLSDKSIKAYRSDLQQFGVWLREENKNFKELECISLYIESLQNDKHYSDSSIKRKYISLKSFYCFSVKNDVVFKSFKFKSEKKLPKTLTIPEVVRMLKTLDNELVELSSEFRKCICIRDNAIIELLFCTGIRIGELVDIKLQDIDIETHTLLIHGKGRKQRLLYISSQQVISKIALWIATRDSLNPKCDYIFINKYGNKLSIYSIENIFYKYRELSDINKHATPHYLRHPYVKHTLKFLLNIYTYLLALTKSSNFQHISI